jgi:hypothetical protein
VPSFLPSTGDFVVHVNGFDARNVVHSGAGAASQSDIDSKGAWRDAHGCLHAIHDVETPAGFS